MDLNETLKGVRRKDRKAQKALYEAYAPVLMAIGIRYMKDVHLAEDMVAEAFIKIFTKIRSYKDEGSFEGWMKRIMINECLMQLRKNQRQYMYVPVEQAEIEIDPVALDELGEAEILKVVSELPEGYRTVFNLYVIEGYKHREIAEILGISIHTSKSQLIMAKRRLQEIIKKNIIGDYHEAMDTSAG